MGCADLAISLGTRGCKPSTEEECPMCGQRGVLGPHHWIAICEGAEGIREEFVESGGELGPRDGDLLWALHSSCPPEVLKKRVRLVGRIMGRVGLARGKKPVRDMGAPDQTRARG